MVYKDGTPVWATNYYGFILEPEALTQDVYNFLRSALMQEYDGIIPVRGPREYKDGESIYLNSADGGLERFSGTEEIMFKGKKVYTCWYHGGSID